MQPKAQSKARPFVGMLILQVLEGTHRAVTFKELIAGLEGLLRKRLPASMRKDVHEVMEQGAKLGYIQKQKQAYSVEPVNASTTITIEQPPSGVNLADLEPSFAFARNISSHGRRRTPLTVPGFPTKTKCDDAAFRKKQRLRSRHIASRHLNRSRTLAQNKLRWKPCLFCSTTHCTYPQKVRVF